MPNDTNARNRDTATGSAKKDDHSQIVDLFGFIGLHELADVFKPDPELEAEPELGAEPEAGEGDGAEAGDADGEPTRRRGRSCAYPEVALLAVLASGRVTGSLTSALQALHGNPELWQKCVAAYLQRSGVTLPPVPPTRDQVIYLRDRLARDEALMGRLQLRFRRLAVGQAKHQGNLRPGVVPNGADPQEAHIIYGDGTVIAKYSEVREVTDPASGKKVVVGGRAKSSARARIQRTVSDTVIEDDKKGTSGLNMVAMHTYTKAGRITLGTGVALGGEAWAALELIESLHEIAGDGIHSVIYDRALTGWHVEHLMANHRIQVIGKGVAASNSRADGENAAWDRASEADVNDTVHRRLAEYGVTHNSDAAFLVRQDVLADMLRHYERMPLGLCIYPTDKGNYERVNSWWHELDPVTHDVTQGTCTHRIALDDGGLFEVDEHPEDDNRLIKLRVLRCSISTPFQRPDGRWGTQSTYPITCPHGDIEYIHIWEPVGTRHQPTSDPANRAPKDPIGWRLRPLSRPDDTAAWYNAHKYPAQNNRHDTDRDADGTAEREVFPQPFSDVYSRRNDAESHNQWYQQSLPHHGRATSLDPAAQELDFLLAALLQNSNTWANRR